MIRLVEPVKTEFLKDGAWTTVHADDVKLEIYDSGEVYVTAESSGLSKIRLAYQVPDEMKDCYMYGDAWERAYADLAWSKKRRIMPWYCFFTDLKTTWGFGVKTAPNAFCFWSFDGEFLYVTLDIRNGSEELFLNGRTLCAATLVSEIYDSPLDEATCDFCKKMCDNPRLTKYPVYGGNDWYCNAGISSYEKIMIHAKRIAECAPDTENRPYMVVDSGWQMHITEGEGVCAGGPWEPNERFGDMKKLAQEISDLNVLPGIWVRLLYVEEEVPKESVLKPFGNGYILDPSREEVLTAVKCDIRKMCDWGYKLIKHDFSTFDILGKFGASMGEEPIAENVVFTDKSKTTAQIIKDFYMAIREAAGEDAVIIGCNTISHLSAGIFELQRTGDDTSAWDWVRTPNYGVNTLAHRMMQHNTFYAVDADCVGIPDNAEVSWDINRQWLDVLAKSGTPLFVSIGENAYTDEVKADLKAAFEKAAEVHNTSRAIDFIENYTPQKWESDFGTDEYDWKLSEFTKK